MQSIPDISVVVPLYNEAESLPELVAWIDRVAAEHGYTVDETNDILYEKGLPLLTTER